MATAYRFSALSDGAAISFDPHSDVLNFDQTAISAADIQALTEGADVRLTVISGAHAGKDVLLSDVNLLQLASFNISFANGSRLLLGDNSVALNDNAANLLTGSAGNDLLNGLGGIDTLNGGGGNDRYIVGAGDVLNDTGGVDSVVSEVSWTLGAAFENLTLAGSASINGFGNNLQNKIIGNSAHNTIGGGSSNDTIVAGAGNDSINGNNGSDWLESGLGNDTVTGGSGQDVIMFREAGAANADLLTDFASTWDALRLDATAFSNIGAAGRFTAADPRFHSAPGATGGHDDNDRIVFNSSTGQLLYDANGSASGGTQLIATLSAGRAVVAGDITVEGLATPAPEKPPPPPEEPAPVGTINGTSGNDSLNGGAGNDTLNGLAGDDTLDGGLGKDALHGGAGADSYAFSVPAGHVDADAIVGFESRVDELVLDGKVHANAGPSGNFSADDARFFHGYPWAGQDRTDRLIYTPDGLLYWDADGSGPGSAEHIATLVGAPVLLATDIYVTVAVTNGTSGNDSLMGYAGDDAIYGFGGNDSLGGMDGNDTLDGGPDTDTLDGGTGEDALAGGAGADSFVYAVTPGQANADVISDFASGTDKLVLHGTAHANSGPSGNLSATDARFFAADAGYFANAGGISGQDGTDRLVYNMTTGELHYDADGDGLEPALRIATLQGAPSLAATDITVINGSSTGGSPGVVINGSAGNDSLVGTGGNDAIDGLAGDDTLLGGPDKDFLTGGLGLDLLVGGAGDDTLDGANGPGASEEWHLGPSFPGDTLEGGPGDDTYYVQAGDAIREEANGGIDWVLTDTWWYELGPNLENLTFAPIEQWASDGMNFPYVSIEYQGNELANYISSGHSLVTWMPGEERDVIAGGAGDDILHGGWGISVLRGDAGADALYGNMGNDFLEGGEGGDTLDGGPDADNLTGGAGEDVLDGGSGIDTMDGGDGADTYFATAGDVVTDSGAAGAIDTVHSFAASWTLENSFETLILETGAVNGTGNPLSNTLVGNSTANTLTGGIGSDTLTGGAGADSFVYAETPGIGNADVIRDFMPASDKLVLDGTAHLDPGASGDFAATDPRFWSAPGATGGHDADDRVIYDETTGDVYYDADGDAPGGAAAERIATLQGPPELGVPKLAASNISIINGSSTLPPPPSPPPSGGQTINGTTANDTLVGTAADDTMDGLYGDDLMQGMGGNDSLFGAAGKDTLQGGDGSDSLRGYWWSDTLTGGAGADSFVYTEYGTNHKDRITDFEVGVDELLFENANFAALGNSGAWAAGDGRFLTASGTTTSGRDADDRLIYNTDTDTLYYDADGGSSATGQIVAVFTGNPNITASDITVI